jgi:hypothetical protein
MSLSFLDWMVGLLLLMWVLLLMLLVSHQLHRLRLSRGPL